MQLGGGIAEEVEEEVAEYVDVVALLIVEVLSVVMLFDEVELDETADEVELGVIELDEMDDSVKLDDTVDVAELDDEVDETELEREEGAELVRMIDGVEVADELDAELDSEAIDEAELEEDSALEDDAELVVGDAELASEKIEVELEDVDDIDGVEPDMDGAVELADEDNEEVVEIE